VHHRKEADSLKLKLLLMETMMFCLQYSDSSFAKAISGVASCGNDNKISIDVH
jgi:hypothetical protein